MDNRQEQIEQAKRLIATGISEELVEVLHQQFPELKESEDERIRKNCIHFLELQKVHHADTSEIDDCIAYLEMQKEPLTPEEKMNHPLYLEGFDVGRRVGEVVAKPAEWSEEDEEMLVGIIERGSAQIPPHEPALREEQMEWLMNRLKSLRPHPHWKPSEEEMKAMEEVRTIFHNHHLWDEINPILYDYEELMRDLKKLM